MSDQAKTLSIYTIGDVDYLVAESEDDAWNLWTDLTGETDIDYREGMRRLPDDEVLRIWCGPDGHPTEPSEGTKALVIQSAIKWAAQEPRGFLCSTEY